MGKNQKDVKPITARQTGELARLLEERGVGPRTFQKTLVENVDGLVFFIREKFGYLIGKTITFELTDRGYIFEIDSKSNRILGISRCSYDYAMGNILRVEDRVVLNYNQVARSKGTPGFVVKIHKPDPPGYPQRGLIEVDFQDGHNTSRIGFENLNW